MDLCNTGGSGVSYNRMTWAFLLSTARDFGWEPAGTVSRLYDDWEGGYGSNDGQTVTTSDAAALAEALERCLEESAETISPNAREVLDEFVAFAKEGSFEIY